MLLELKAGTEQRLRESAERHHVDLDMHADQLVTWALALLQRNEDQLATLPMDSREALYHDPRIGWVTWDLDENNSASRVEEPGEDGQGG